MGLTGVKGVLGVMGVMGVMDLIGVGLDRGLTGRHDKRNGFRQI